MTQHAVSTEEEVYNATIIDRNDYTAELSVVRIRPDSGLAPEFLPGQFIKIGLPRDPSEETAIRPGRERTGSRLVRRAYSIASSPLERKYIELLIVRVGVGKLTPKLWGLHEGGRLWMEEKTAGRFTLEPIPPDKDIVMVATGTGIAPYISMLRTYADQPRWRRAVVINGVRYAADLGYREELEELARVNPRITYLPIASREPVSSEDHPADDEQVWTGLRGRVQQILEPRMYESLVGAPLATSESHVMLCGNPDMIVSVQRMLEERGFHVHSPTQPGNIHFERYW